MSDRKIADRLGVSQPTVTRQRARLVKLGVICGYTVLVDFSKLGFKIEAYSIIPHDLSTIVGLTIDERVILLRKLDAPNKMIVISIHKDYSDYVTFADKYLVEGCHSFLALTSRKPMKPFSLGDIDL